MLTAAASPIPNSADLTIVLITVAEFIVVQHSRAQHCSRADLLSPKWRKSKSFDVFVAPGPSAPYADPGSKREERLRDGRKPHRAPVGIGAN